MQTNIDHGHDVDEGVLYDRAEHNDHRFVKPIGDLEWFWFVGDLVGCGVRAVASSCWPHRLQVRLKIGPDNGKTGMITHVHRQGSKTNRKEVVEAVTIITATPPLKSDCRNIFKGFLF
jgi:hypothetical protein